MEVVSSEVLFCGFLKGDKDKVLLKTTGGNHLMQEHSDLIMNEYRFVDLLVFVVPYCFIYQ